MNIFPHIICWDLQRGEHFWPLALPGSVLTLLLVAGCPLLLFRLWRLVEKDVAAGWWAFLFEGFRLDCRWFVLVLLGKDILLNLISVVLPGLGTAQLLVTAMLSSSFAYLIRITKPYDDMSNNVLEASTSTSVALLCMFSAGMGFQTEPEVLDISTYLKDGRNNPVYLQRALALVCLQGLSLFAPAVIITYQVLTAFPRTRRCIIPRALLPPTEDDLEIWRQDYATAVDKLDDVALVTLHGLVMSSKAARKCVRDSRASKTSLSLSSVSLHGEAVEPAQRAESTELVGDMEEAADGAVGQSGSGSGVGQKLSLSLSSVSLHGEAVKPAQTAESAELVGDLHGEEVALVDDAAQQLQSQPAVELRAEAPAVLTKKLAL